MGSTFQDLAWACLCAVIIPVVAVIVFKKSKRASDDSIGDAGRAVEAKSGASPRAASPSTESDAHNEDATPVPTTPNRYTVMTYNILAPDYANPSWFPGTNRGQLKWAHREPKILRDIDARNADILCLQEIQRGVCREVFWRHLEKLGYGCAYTAKCTETGELFFDRSTLGVLACWKKDKFRQVGEPRTIALARETSNLFDGDRYFSSGNFQVGVATLLQRITATPTKSPQFIVVISVHMMAPRGDTDYRRKYEQVAQTCGLLQALANLKKDMAEDPRKPFVRREPMGATTTWFDACRRMESKMDEPTQAPKPLQGKPEVMFLVCGDFNAPPDSPSGVLLKHGFHEAGSKIRLLKELLKASVHSSEQQTIERLDLEKLDTSAFPKLDSTFEVVHGVEPLHTNYTVGFKSCIDYIFVEAAEDGTDNGQWLSPVAVETFPHFRLDELFRGTPQRSLPSDRFPSDHLPVIVEFEARAPDSDSE